MVKTALVVGGGIGGLALATRLAEAGMEVRLLEQADAITEVGAGLQISPNGLAVLQALGLEEQLVWSGAMRARAVVLADYRRRGEVARLDLSRLGDRRYYFVHRADLIGLLLRAARSAGVEIDLGQQVLEITPGPRPALATTCGRALDADVVLCADGLHSMGRAVLNGAEEPSFTGQVAWRAVVPVEDFRPEARVTMAPGRHLVTYPLKDGSAVNLVAVHERAAWAAEGWSHADDPDALRAAFADVEGYAKALLKEVTQVNLWGLFRHPVAETWVGENVALLGDAAHPTLPFLAQGANLALEDAYALSDTVLRGLPLERYQTLRRDRAIRVIEAANRNAWKYHLRNPVVRRVAHGVLWGAGRLAPGPMMRQFDWIYRYDVRAACAQAA